eukprot:g16761.t1
MQMDTASQLGVESPSNRAKRSSVLRRRWDAPSDGVKLSELWRRKRQGTGRRLWSPVLCAEVAQNAWPGGGTPPATE